MAQNGTCADLFARYGVPTLLKVDVDGGEAVCLAGLPRELPEPLRAYLLPRYVAAEIGGRHQATAVVEELRARGYQRFKLCRQHFYNRFAHRLPERYAASGPFGRFAVDFRVGEQWRTADEILADLPEVLADVADNGEWYDLHAERDDSA